MKLDEFMHDYSLEYLTYMINKYVEENFDKEENEEVTHHISDFL